MTERYKRIKILGKGKFGVVYLACEGQKFVAIKKYTDLRNKDIPYQVLREISVMKVLSHPNIIQIHGIYEQGFDIEMVMEYWGENLESFYLRTEYLNRIELLPSISRQILAACQYLHVSGVLHRDLKPDNILIQDGVVKLCDFGLAKKISPLQSRRHSYQMGTLHYRPPELFVKDQQFYDQSVDVWSIGCVLYEYVIGKPVFAGESALVVLWNIFTQVPTSAEDLQKLQMPTDTAYNTDAFYKLPPLYNFQDNISASNVKLLESFKQLVQMMLIIDPGKRITLQDALAHPFIDSKNLVTACDFTKYFYKRPSCKISIDLRYIWIDYMIDTFSKYRLNKQTLALAINIFDEYVNKEKTPVEKLNIVAIVSLMIASKHIDVRALKLESFATVYKEKDLISWERKIVQTIQYRLHQPTVLNIYRELCPSLEGITETHWKVILKMLQDYRPLQDKSYTQLKSLIKQHI
jgi:serine/threonine protein kinase